jgi:TonB-dependent SusC/RagA subfamily outer membrane receptor
MSARLLHRLLHPWPSLLRLLLAGALSASLSPSTVVAQETGIVAGRVVLQGTDQPVNLAQVVIVGTQMGSLTGADGRFEIRNVPVGEHQLRAMQLGMTPVMQAVTVTSGATTTVTISMARAALELDAIVVTGTVGAARQREVGNAISVISPGLKPSLPVNMETMLQAQAPGMTVLQGSGQIGGAAQIRLRGNVSASMSNQPLLYIDGVRVRSEPYPNPSVVGRRSNNENTSPLNDINPADIERIEIIKGAAASTLYGTEAAAGVIQIFTKRGTSGRTVWEFETQHGLQKLMPFSPDPEPYFYLDPWLENGPQHQYNLSVRGGANSLKYYASGTLEDRKGVLPNESLKRKAARGNFTFSPLDNLTVEWNNFINSSAITNVAGGVNPSGFIMGVMRQQFNHLSSADPEDISKLLDQDFDTDIDRLNMGVTATYLLRPNWTTRLTVGYDHATNVETRLRPYGFVLEPRGDLNVRNFSTAQGTIDLNSTLQLELGSELQTSFSAGGQFISTDENTLDGYALNFPGPTNPTLSTGSIQSVTEERLRVLTGGFFVQNLTGFRDRYFLTTGLRIDGSSAFGSGFGLQMYPKISGSYVISDEDFWPESFGQMKLRAALGSAGRAPGAFDAIKTWNPIGFGLEAAYQPQNLGNPDLGPERTLETELGFDWSVFGGRISTEFTYYNGHTKDALFPVRSIPSTGFQSSQLRNVGEIQNKGTELLMTFRVLDHAPVNWTVSASYATNHSKVLSLGEATPVSLGNRGWLLEGEPLMVIRGVKLLNPDELADPVVQEDYIFGPNSPTRMIGFSTILELPWNITLSARGEYQGGHYVSDGSSEDAASRAITTWPRCLAGNALREAGRGDETTAKNRLLCDSRFYEQGAFIQKADFFKVRDITARVGLPFRVPKVSSAFLTLSAQNWIRWVNDDFDIFEPEMMGSAEPGVQRVRALGIGVTPPPSTFMASLRLVF